MADRDGPGEAAAALRRGQADGPLYLIRDAGLWRPSPVPPQSGAAVFDPRAIVEVLLQGHVSPPDTLVRGVVALRPGEMARTDQRSGLSLQPAAPPQPERGGLRPVLVDILSELGDSRCGVLLSGGVDSAWLAALAARRGPTEAFTTVFAQLQHVDFAADAAYQAGVTRHAVDGDGRLVWAWLRLVRETGLPQPDLGGAAILLAVEAAGAAGCSSVLSGLGADEIAGGRVALGVPPAWAMRRLPSVAWSADDARQAYGLVPPRYPEWAVLLRLRCELLAPELLQREPYLAALPPAPPVDPVRIAEAGPVVGGWLFEQSGRLGAGSLPTIAAIERLTGARVVLPYLDPRAVVRGLAEYGPDKPAIRSGSRRELPDQIRARPKLARRRPDVHWLLGDPLPDCIAAALAPQALAATGWFDPVTVHHWLQQVRAKPFGKLNRLRTRLLVTAAAIQILANDAA